MLPGHQPEPRSQLFAVVKLLRVPDGGDQRTGSDRTDAANFIELAAGIVFTMPGLDLQLKLADLFFEFVEFLKERPCCTGSAGWRADPDANRSAGLLCIPEEEAKLRSPAYQGELVHALAIGIQCYFAKNPPLARSRQL